MKTLKFLVFAVLAVSMATGCLDFVTPRQEPDNSDEQMVLTGTKWKLANIRNLATGELKTLEPYHSNGLYEKECFSFTFEDDTLAYGRSCTNKMLVNIKGTNGSYLGCMTEVYEGTADCIYFSNILYFVDDCFFEEDQLIFAYTQDNVRHHLQFKQVKE